MRRDGGAVRLAVVALLLSRVMMFHGLAVNVPFDNEACDSFPASSVS